ncbi:hypothetical protein K1719_022318 [Acacia pycnantha]|nr:hypothetical protein K1719_022318 [Acacia pycnantha]
MKTHVLALGIIRSLKPSLFKTSDLVSCAENFCSDIYDGPFAGCKPDVACPYSVTYGDGSSTTGYLVKDYLTFNQPDAKHIAARGIGEADKEASACTIKGLGQVARYMWEEAAWHKEVIWFEVKEEVIVVSEHDYLVS